MATSARSPNPDIFCIQTVVIGDILLDFESFAIVAGGTRYLLSRRDFDLICYVMIMEGEAVSEPNLANHFRLKSSNVRPKADSLKGSQIARLVRQVNRRMLMPAHIGVIVRDGPFYTFIRQRAEMRQSPAAAA